MQSQRVGFGLAVAAAVTWSLTGPGIAYLLDVYHLPRLTVAFWRDVFALLVVLPPVVLRYGIPERRDLVRYAIGGTLFIGFYHALWVFSVGYNGSAVAVVLVYMFPAFATLGAWLLWHEQPSQAAVVGLVLAFMGCLLVVQLYETDMLALRWAGIVCGIATAVMQAGYGLFSRRVVRAAPPLVVLAWMMAFGTLALLVVQRPATILAVGPGAWPWLVLAAVGIGPTLGGYLLFTMALRSLPAGVAGTISMLEAPVGAILAAALLGQWLRWPQIVGLLLILGGATLPQIWRRRPAGAVTQSAPAP